MWRRLLLGLIAAALLACASPGAAFAQDIFVNTTDDGPVGECDAECTLREAVTVANDRRDNPTIVLKAETYSLEQGELLLRGTFTIKGAGARATTIDSNGAGRVAYVAPGGDLTVNDLTVTGGSEFGKVEDPNLGGGFRVAADAKLTLIETTVTGNSAGSSGGGISNAGQMQIERSTISFNDAGDGTPAGGQGGGIHVESGATTVLRNSTVSGNTAFAGADQQASQGGGVYTDGPLSMVNVTIARNDATAGAGLYQAAPDGPISMWNTLIAENFEQACAGAVGVIVGGHNLADDDTCKFDDPGDRQNGFAGLGPLTDRGGPTDTHVPFAGSDAIDQASAEQCPTIDQRLFDRPRGEACDIGAVERRLPPVVSTFADDDDGVCEPGDCTLREALADSEEDEQITLAKGVYELTLGELQLRGDRMIFGQGARNATTIKATGPYRVLSVIAGTSHVEGVEITGGDVVDGQGAEGPIGGGILVRPGAALSVFESAIQGNHAAAGGGIANQGTLAIVSSTIASNEATGQAGGGGGLFMDDLSGSYVENSTVSGNTAVAPGGGVANIGGTLYTLNITIAKNQAPTGAGIYGDAPDGSFFAGDTTMTNTIIATNAGAQCAWTTAHERFLDHNLADDRSCFQGGVGNKVRPNSGIDALSQDFGATDLYPLLDGSPAIDGGNDFDCAITDQRGVDRPQGPRCDIGAFEGGVGAPNLRVVTQIPDDSAAASDFTLHVFSAGKEVDSAPGSESGTPFDLDPGTYEIRRSGPDDYIRSFSGDCDGFGKVTIQADETRTCTLTLDQVTAPPDDACLSYPTFAQAGGLNLLGDAAIAGDVLRLNPDTGGLGGAWFGGRRQVGSGFTADFTFRITPPDGGADGLAFVIQNHDVDALGLSGGGIGYQGIPNSLAVELDTFGNFQNDDPDGNHVAVHSLGTEANHAGAQARLGVASLPTSIKDGNAHAVRVVYAPGTLEIFVDDMTVPALTVDDLDLSALLALEDGAAFVGFTAATGGVTEGHNILSWSLCPAAPATLNVVTEVDDEGGWLPEDFTVGVLSDGADVAGSPQPGDAEGTSYTLPPGTYEVSEAGARGYAATFGGDCEANGTVTLGAESTMTCTITNKPVPVGDGLVVESYEPSRADGDYGLTESNLTMARGYLEDPANFGPNGIVAQPLLVAPGIREANARTLAGVDVFFTGWVSTSSYTEEERTALHDFVLGGGTLIATTDATDHTMVDLFGLTQGNGTGPTSNTITDLDHPIAAGPFGMVTAFNQYFDTGHYVAPLNDAIEVGRNDAGTSLAVIERDKLGEGSGAAIFVADVDVFSDPGGASENAALIKNIFAFAIGQTAQPVLTIGDVSTAEGAAGGTTTFTFTVALSGGGADPVSVHYATANDTATAPSDYAAASGDLEFAPGETAKPVSITVNGDTEVEADERFRVNLSNAGGARIADSQGVGTIGNDDVATVVQAQQQEPQQPQQPQEEEPPPPEAGKTVNAEPKSGTVTIKLKGTNKFVELKEGESVPVGSVLDTTKGRVTLVAASDKSGGTATADFYDGIFEVGQTKGSKPITTLELVEKLSCATGKASTAAKRNRKRRLWGDGSGRFRTEGEFSSATVRGTKWLVEDQCKSTLTKVARGKVAVRDFVKRKTVVVKAGQQYVARARR